MTTRAEVCAQARLWIGTPFQHQQRARGVAVDCVGLIIGVARDLGLVAADFDVNGYPRVPDGRSLTALCREHMRPIERAAMQAGDVIEVAFDRDPQHLGVLVDYLHGGLAMVHASQTSARVVEHRLMFSQAMQFRAAYALPGIEG